MPAFATTPPASTRDVGDTWVLGVAVTDDLTGALTTATVGMVVTRPDGTTSTLTVVQDSAGYFHGLYVISAAGRHTAKVTVSGTVTSVVTFATDGVVVATMPTLADVKAYMGSSAASWQDAEVTDALAAETAAQARSCVVGATYSADLRQALLRRVQRNLALRRMPLAVLQGDADGGSMVLPGRDPEVRRLEAPYRRVVVA